MVIFGAGVVTGGLLVRQAQGPSHGLHPREQRPQPPRLQPPLPLLDSMMGRMQRELALTPDQQEHIERILRASRESGRRLMQETVGKIRDELTPEQAVQFDQLLKQQRQQQPQRPRRTEGFDPPSRPMDQNPPPQQQSRPPGDWSPPVQPPPAGG